MGLFALLALSASFQAQQQPTHWLGELRILSAPGETVSSEQGPDFTVHHVRKDGRVLLSAYHGTHPNVSHYRLQRFRRACGVQYFRLWSRGSRPARIEGYLVRREAFVSHLFGEAVTGNREALRAFERRIDFPDC
jgi:hypothetical protein